MSRAKFKVVSFVKFVKKFGRPPPSAHGAWVTKPIKNWIKATELLRQHDKSDWHLACVEQQLTYIKLGKPSDGSICERMLSIGEKKEKNHILVKFY